MVRPTPNHLRLAIGDGADLLSNKASAAYHVSVYRGHLTKMRTIEPNAKRRKPDIVWTLVSGPLDVIATDRLVAAAIQLVAARSYKRPGDDLTLGAATDIILLPSTTSSNAAEPELT